MPPKKDVSLMGWWWYKLLKQSRMLGGCGVKKTNEIKIVDSQLTVNPIPTIDHIRIWRANEISDHFSPGQWRFSNWKRRVPNTFERNAPFTFQLATMVDSTAYPSHLENDLESYNDNTINVHWRNPIVV